MALCIIMTTFMHRNVGCLLAAMALLAADLGAQPYPTKVIRIITTAPGSGTDVTARIVARGLTAALGQQVIVDKSRHRRCGNHRQVATRWLQPVALHQPGVAAAFYS